MAMENDDSNSIYVPEDVVFMEILVRLPVESLLRFLCVSKSWYAFIKSPNFISTHFNFASSDDQASRIVVINDVFDTPHTITVLSSDGVKIYQDIPNSFSAEINLDLFGSIELSSPCNGVICVCTCFGFDVVRAALWNPATREINYLVLGEGYADCRDKDDEDILTLIGFGINTKNNFYKVVRCRQFGSKFLVHIYDVGNNNNNNSWRKLGVIDLPVTGKFDGSVYADGFCYWLVFLEYFSPFVLSFDFINEAFERIPTPLAAIAKFNGLPSLATFDKSVAFIGPSESHDCDVVWVLNREGDQKTWCKQFSLPKVSQFCPQFLRSGKVVILCFKELCLYDPRSQECKKLMDFFTCCDVKTMTYVESLVSFKKYFSPYPKLQISDCEPFHNGQG